MVLDHLHVHKGSADLVGQRGTIAGADERTARHSAKHTELRQAALDQALNELDAEGGVAARGARYGANCGVLVSGLRDLGFETFLPDLLQAPIIVTVRMPADPAFDFARLYDLLNDRGIVLYPGAITQEISFRIGCIGRIGETDMKRALGAIEQALGQMGVSREGLRPAS